MNNITRALFVALTFSVISHPAFGDETTIDPNSYAAGQNISNVVPGVQLQALSVEVNPDSNAPTDQALIPVYSPVFASAITSTCNGGTSCAPSGTQVFGYSPVRAPSTAPILWGSAVSAGNCLSGSCDLLQGNNLQFPALVVTFSDPTNSVTVVGNFFDGQGSYIEAFNSQNQLIGTCTGSSATPTACTTPAALNSPIPDGGWLNYTISETSPDISYLVAGGTDLAKSIGEIKYNAQSVPLPSGLSLLAGGILLLTAFRRRIVAATLKG